MLFSNFPSGGKSVIAAAVFTGASDTLRGTAVGSTSSFATLGTTPTAGDLILGLCSNESNGALSLNTTSPNID